MLRQESKNFLPQIFLCGFSNSRIGRKKRRGQSSFVSAFPQRIFKNIFYPAAKYDTIRKDVRQRIFLPWRWKEYE